MNEFLSYFATLALMAVVVLAFRLFVRRPRGVSMDDPPGVRTVAVFAGDDPEFLRDDLADGPLVGIRLFTQMLAGLQAAGVEISNRGPVECAQGAECALDGERFALVFEWIDPRWVAAVEFLPRSAAERRHATMTRRIYAPADTPALRRLLTALDGWIKAHPKLSALRWHRKERWLMEDPSDPAEGPFAYPSRSA